MPHITTLVEKWFMFSAAIAMQKILLTHLPEGSTYRVEVILYSVHSQHACMVQTEPSLLAKRNRVMLRGFQLLGSLEGNSSIWHLLADRCRGLRNPGSIELSI